MNCTGLESLTLQGCEQLSDDGVVALMKRCPNIAALNLRAVCDLTEVRILVWALCCLYWPSCMASCFSP